MNLKSLQQQIMAFRDSRKWKEPRSARYVLFGLLVEAGELAQVLAWKTEKEFTAFLKTKKGHKAVADELSDVLYWLLLIANDFGIDLESAFKDKMKRNAKKYPATNKKPGPKLKQI